MAGIASNSASTVTASAGIVNVYGPVPESVTVPMALLTTSEPLFRRIPDLGVTVKVTVAAAAAVARSEVTALVKSPATLVGVLIVTA